MKLIYGDEQYFIKAELDKIKEHFDDENVYVIDAEAKYEELEQLLLEQSLFAKTKLIIINNLPFLVQEKQNKNNKAKYSNFLEILQSNQINEIVFVVNKTTLPKNDVSDFIVKNSEIVEVQKISKKDMVSFVSDRLNKSQVSHNYNELIYLLDKLPDNLEIIMNELDKLSILKQPLTIDLIDTFITSCPADDPFSFSNAISKNDFTLIYKKYLEKKLSGFDALSLIHQISSTFCLVNQIYWYKQLGLTYTKIAQMLNMNEKRIKVHVWILDKYGYGRVKKIIQNLAKADKECKSLGVDNYDIFETFLVTNFARDKE
ncbi:hypothetical protein H9M94_01625 [Mycoplasma sp. Pen4]|uniref:DNA polymerase III subunit delta n=1 Tax=Mycoplasma sp. Pen4 TaxID=640330 RepID=UPI0016544B71|nr:hypothetical protein [Mycoplasma sp. Pen4]QNM93312.1 hypothetical protein H9M94_01625 [Mycoplasma sp. Pen4]